MASPREALMPDFLRELREFCRAERGRVTELAVHLGIAQPHVSAWLAGKQQPSGEHTLRIQRWLAARRRDPAASRPRTVSPEAEEAPLPAWLL
jgi:transcriptional regulator with XRE-family HTH domain